jgi:hypothetical protein
VVGNLEVLTAIEFLGLDATDVLHPADKLKRGVLALALREKLLGEIVGVKAGLILVFLRLTSFAGASIQGPIIKFAAL